MSTIFEVCHDDDRALAIQSERLLQQAEVAADPKVVAAQARQGGHTPALPAGRPKSGFKLVRLVTGLFAGGNP